MHPHSPMEQPVRRPGVARYIAAARHWWPLVVIPALLGAMFGVWSSSTSPYTSTVLLQVNASSPQGQTNETAAQTALRIIESDEVFNRAREVLGESGAGLRARTELARITDTELLSVQVSAPTAEQAERETDAVTAAGLEVIQALAQQQFDAIDQAGGRALGDGVLDDGAAELARLQALGQAAANRQDAAQIASLLLTRVGEPQAAYQTGLGATTAGAIGLLVGLIPGIVLAVLYGRRFGRVRRPADVLEAIARAEVRDRSGITRIAGRCAGRPAPLIGMLSMSGARAELTELTAFLDTELRTDDRRPYILWSGDLQATANPPAEPVTVPAQAPATEPPPAGSPARVSPEPVTVAASARPSPRPRPTAADDGEDGGEDGETRPKREPLVPYRSSTPNGSSKASTSSSDGLFTVKVEETVRLRPRPAEPAPAGQATPGAKPAAVPGQVGRPRPAPALGRHRERDLAAVGRDALIVSSEYAPEVAARLAGRADVVVLVARRGQTRVRQLIQAGRDLEDTNLTVILT